MRDKDQKGILSKGEIELLRNTFSGEGESLLYYIRDVFLQFPLQEDVKPLTQDVLDVLRKYILPDLSPDLPIKSQADLYFSLDKIKEIPPEVAYLHIEALDIMAEYLSERFYALEGEPADNEIQLASLKLPLNKLKEERFVEMIAYQSIVAYVDSSLERIRIIANSKDETEEEKNKRLEMDSSK